MTARVLLQVFVDSPGEFHEYIPRTDEEQVIAAGVDGIEGVAIQACVLILLPACRIGVTAFFIELSGKFADPTFKKQADGKT
ncbi:MAG: hypothetical protein BWY25_02585 [Chloroflexi bacterium ADurb.Bin222]|nr:MAG: hypothetical protein BWY25_02585 [Chloroflexi bacterium ADurb.Bin222]